MSRRRLLIGGTTMAAILALAVWLGLREREPAYEGKSLSQWILAMKDGPDRQKARVVVHRMGTNSLPLLLGWLKRDDELAYTLNPTVLKNQADAWLQSRRLLAVHPLTYPPIGLSHRYKAMQAFAEMGPDAEAAIPALIKMLGDKRPRSSEFSVVAGSAFMILPKTAPKCVGPLTQALSSPDPQVRMIACAILGQLGGDARSAIPAIRLLREDENARTRLCACGALDELGEDPSEFVPVVVKSLREWTFESLEFQLGILARHPAKAKAAVPLLMGMLTNSAGSNGPLIRAEVLPILQKIDPDAAAKAGLN
jgi:HEAT repeats